MQGKGRGNSRFADVRQFAAFAGILLAAASPAPSSTARVCKTGDHSLRSAMFMAALSASLHNPSVHAFARQIRAQRPDLGSKQVICACAHKLLRIIFGVVKSRRPFEHDLGGQPSPPPKIRQKRTDDRASDADQTRGQQHTGEFARQTLGQLRAQLDRKTGKHHPMDPIGGNAFDGC